MCSVKEPIKPTVCHYFKSEIISAITMLRNIRNFDQMKKHFFELTMKLTPENSRHTELYTLKTRNLTSLQHDGSRTKTKLKFSPIVDKLLLI